MYVHCTVLYQILQIFFTNSRGNNGHVLVLQTIRFEEGNRKIRKWFVWKNE